MSAEHPTVGAPALRASDADRDRVVDLLRAAVTDGRLDPGEFDERLEATLSARTFDALAPLTADLLAPPHGGGAGVVAGTALAMPTTTPEPAAELLTIREKHGMVRREGRWTLPRRLEVRTSWSAVLLDLTKAVRSGPELVIEMKVVGGTIDLVLTPDMAVDANGLAVRYSHLDLGNDTDEGAPETLSVHLVGSMKHARVTTRRRPPR